MDFDRRGVMFGGAASVLAASIARAAAIDADVRTGTLADVEHVVILMQENRSFDHYFGAMNGVRGFADRFPIPLADAPNASGRTVWTQVNRPERPDGPALISPFPLNTAANFAHMRIEGTPHNWADAQTAWDEGRMGAWPVSKTERSMGYYRREDIPFQYALADAFTLCDAYHASIHCGTNSNRLFLWTGTNDPGGRAGGPSISNSHDSLVGHGGRPDSYRWTTYVERLQAAGVGWRIYQDMADNFSDNPTAGFKSFRDSLDRLPGSDPLLAELGLSTRALDGLKADVQTGQLPKVSYIVAPSFDSEHPGPSSPAQGADYTARVLDALTADPRVWSRTVLLVMYDENDGFFDHVPPPAPPSVVAGESAGGSSVDTAGEYHLVTTPSEAGAERPELMGRPYGLGPRVPLLVISPWSRGGWVNSQVFDHTSVIRFLEARFGVAEPNISPWRRAVCGDLTSAFDFKSPNNSSVVGSFPGTRELAAMAAALHGKVKPPAPAAPDAPMQQGGTRPSRALPYVLGVSEIEGGSFGLRFHNDGDAGAVFHVYDRRHLDRVPCRFTLGPRTMIDGVWDAGDYDLWVLGPNGFHRHFIGNTDQSPLSTIVSLHAQGGRLEIALRNKSIHSIDVSIMPGAYPAMLASWSPRIAPGQGVRREWSLSRTAGWYDLTIRVAGAGTYLRRLAGRLETGRHSVTDPAMAGAAGMKQT
jgi:phospholipase C